VIQTDLYQWAVVVGLYSELRLPPIGHSGFAGMFFLRGCISGVTSHLQTRLTKINTAYFEN